MLAPWKKSYDKSKQHIEKQRHYFANKGPSSQSYGFSSIHIWLGELDHKESWDPKNRCFWTMALEKTLESPWTARRSNQSILKEISPEYSLERLMLKLKLQYTLATWWEELTHWKRPWSWERSKAGGERDDGGCDGWMASLTQWTWVWAISRSWWWTGKSGILQSMGSQRLDTTEWVNWTEWTSFKETGAPLLRERDLLEIQWIDITDNSYVKYIYGKPVTARQSCVWHNMLIDNLMRFTFCVQTIFLNYTNVTNVP